MSASENVDCKPELDDEQTRQIQNNSLTQTQNSPPEVSSFTISPHGSPFILSDFSPFILSDLSPFALRYNKL